jgi:hypothetical protein
MEKSQLLFVQLQPEWNGDQLRDLLETKGVKVLDMIVCGESVMYTIDSPPDLVPDLEQIPGFLKLRQQIFRRI